MVLQINDIYKNFGQKEVLKGISFKAEGGKAFGLLGRNGAGKTTTIRIIMNVFPADKGELTVDGKKIDYSKIKLGYLPEERGLYPKKLIFDQLMFFAELKGMNKTDAAKSIDYWLCRLEMSEHKNKRLDTLSKGNQQKIQLITALVCDPDIIILDEPFSGLDPVNANLIKDIVKEQLEKDKIVLFSGHQMNYIEEFCDDIALLSEGKIALSGNLNQIKRSYPRNKLVVRSVDKLKIIDRFKDKASSLSDDSLLLTLEHESDKQNVSAFLFNSYDVDEIKVFEPSLGDIFVEYTTQK